MDAAEAYAEIAGCARRLRALTGSAGRWFPALADAVLDPADRAGSPQGPATGPACPTTWTRSTYTDPGPDAIVSTVLGKTRPGVDSKPAISVISGNR